MVFGALQKIFDDYFAAPLAQPGEVAPYNWVNTLVFAAIALLAAYLILKGLEKLGIKTDSKFYFSILPFVLFGASVRAAVDAQVLPRSVQLLGVTFYPFVTPLVYVFTFLVAIAAIGGSLVFFRQRFHDAMRFSGSALFLLVTLSYAPFFKNYYYFGVIVALALAGVAAGELLSKIVARFYGKVARGWLERTTVLGHCFDGAATFIGVSFLGYSEQHVVANILFGVGTPLLFFIVKILFASLAVEIISRELQKPEEADKKNYLFLLLMIFGLAPGLRDALRILSGV